MCIYMRIFYIHTYIIIVYQHKYVCFFVCKHVVFMYVNLFFLHTNTTFEQFLENHPRSSSCCFSQVSVCQFFKKKIKKLNGVWPWAGVGMGVPPPTPLHGSAPDRGKGAARASIPADIHPKTARVGTLSGIPHPGPLRPVKRHSINVTFPTLLERPTKTVPKAKQQSSKNAKNRP